MQMFNGLTMGLLDFYNVNLGAETSNNSGENLQEDYYNKLDYYASRIQSITDALTNHEKEDDKNAEDEGKKLIDQMEKNFDENVEGYFKNHPEQLKAFKTKIDSCIISLQKKNEGFLPQAYEPLQEFCNRIDTFLKSLENGVNDNGGVKGSVNELSDGDVNKPSNGDDIKPSIGNDIKTLTGIDERGGDFYEKINTSSETTKIDNLLKTLGDSVNNEDPKITAYREILNNIKKAIENPNSNNTKALQKYILSQLDNPSDKTTFLRKNFKSKDSSRPDGLFGQHTLDGVKIFLTNLEKDINSSVDNSKATESNTLEGNNEKLEKPKAPDYPLTRELKDIKERKDGDAKPSYGSQLQRERPETGGVEEGKRLYETIKHIEEQLQNINSCKDIEGVEDNIRNLKTNLENIQAVIDNTTVENVKELQNFISENLEGNNYKSAFDSLNKKSKGFDGRFGESTLKGLDIILGKVDGYLSEVGNYGKNMKTYNNALKEESTKDDAEKGKTEPKEKTEKAPTNTAPLKMKENGTEKTYLVMENSDDLKVQCNLPGATFYSTESFTPSEGEEDSIYTTNSTKVEINGDREYYMKLSNRPYDTYQVKLDANGNICPTAKNVASGAPILLKDNESCKRYLYNKLPDQLKTKGDQIVIKWNGSDYTIGFKGHDKTLTIEPMTIDEKWIGSLTDSLALLNFTNYLRINKDIHNIEFINNNPNLKVTDNGDLYVKVKRKGNINHDEQGKGWRKVDKDEFGLNGIDPKDLEKFKKYNNHEDWNDNWDNKKENKYYKL